jgi:tetratricopeptide (TPR) repeat protein
MPTQHDTFARIAAGLGVFVLGAVLTGHAQSGARSDGVTSPRAQPASHQQMVALLRKIADESKDTHPFLADRPAREGRAKLAALPTTTPDADRWLVHMDLGEAELRLGNLPQAIDHFSRARDIVSRAGNPASLGPWLGSNLFRLGAAYLRLGESQNCALHAGATNCILPLRGESLHRMQEPSTLAIATFAQVLKAEPNTSLGLSTRWLLNIAHMTLGTYPQQVPDALLIPPQYFESEEPFPRFSNVAPKLGLDGFNLSGGAIADDFDNDGYLDLVVSTSDTSGQMRYFHNDGDGRFSDYTARAGLTGLLGGLNMVQADYDNDGHVDILVLRGAWLAEHGQHPNSLLRNNGDGTFTDVTFDAGLGNVHYPTQTAAWADYDNDGDLDVYIGNESSSTIRAPSQLFRNNGNGTFTDVAGAAGVANDRFAKGVAWGDYNGDRWMDLYVSNRGGVNRLYHNNGDGTFVDVAVPLGVGGPIESFPTWFFDVDNDGVLDLYVAAYAAGIDHLAASALGQPLDIELAKLYRGDGKGRFEDVSSQYNLTRPNAPMGSNFGDLDNDGFLDFYLGTGYPAIHNIMPNVMYHNQGGKRFADVSYAGGFAHLQKGHAVVFADLDHDGDQDVFEQMGGAYPVDLATNVLFENPGFKNHWIAIAVVGSKSNRSGIGARIRAEIVDGGTRRSVFRHVNSGGSFGANPLRQTLGLGTATKIDRLEIFWPLTGETQTFSDVAADQTIRIVEGEASFARLPLRRSVLGGRAGP